MQLLRAVEHCSQLRSPARCPYDTVRQPKTLQPSTLKAMKTMPTGETQCQTRKPAATLPKHENLNLRDILLQLENISLPVVTMVILC